MSPGDRPKSERPPRAAPAGGAAWGVAAALAAVSAAAVGGCAQAQMELSERETASILAGIDTQVAAERAKAREILDTPRDVERTGGAVDVPAVMTLADALRIAAGHNRDLISGREGLTLSALSLRGARNDVGPRLTGSLDYLLAGSDAAEDRVSDGALVGLAGLLPTGGDVTLTGDLNRAYGRGRDAATTADGSLSGRLRQPLLSGVGYEASHEALTGAERQALYDVRDFDLSRQDLAIRVHRDFYSLVSQKKVIANRAKSLENFEFLKRRSEALFEVGRVSEVDKFRATREYLTAENALIDARQEYDARLDRFKILLGIDTEATVDVAEEIPAAAPFEIELKRALDVALVNRLDLMTSRDQVEDAERRVRIREQALLPSLDLDAVYTRASGTERSLRDVGADHDSYSLGLSLELPLDRVRERGALRRARIDLDRARRAESLAEDNVIAAVRDSLRNVRSAENSLAIQQRIVASEEKNAKVARMRFEQGEIGNRDLTDALINLADAQDRLVRETANVATARLQLLRDTGLLIIEEDGTWQDFDRR